MPTELAIIVPSRERAVRITELADAVRRTATTQVQIMVGLDTDDPQFELYMAITDPLVSIWPGERTSLSGWTNRLAMVAAEEGVPYLASLGDDHRPRTQAWDKLLIEAVQATGGGFAYGNDLLQGAAVPTAWVQDTATYEVLTWMMLPLCQHMYVDNAIRELGKAAGKLTYLPGVVIEHLHPVAGKAAWDPVYEATNTDERYDQDRRMFESWRDGGGLAEAVKGLMGMGHGDRSDPAEQ